MWKACKNILPTNYCLSLRKVTMADECVLCGKVESSRHALCDCWLAEAVWKESKLSLPKFSNPHCDFIDVVWKFWKDQRGLDWECLATTAWCIWKNRNVAKFEGKCKQAKTNVLEARAFVEEFNMQNVVPRQIAPPRTGRWTPPCEGWYKVNVDKAVFKESGSYGIETVIRNEKSQIIRVMSKKLGLPLGTLEVEAKAFEEGMLLAVDLGLKNIMLEGDEQVVTNVLSSSSAPSPQALFRFKHWRHNVLVWRVSHVRRIGKIATHLMARNAKLMTDCVTPQIFLKQFSFERE